MPTIAFKQPPLVEIIAEARWDLGLGDVLPQFSNVPMPALNTGAHESHFLNFASKAGARGYGLVERLVPPGFPLLANQPAVRYRSNDPGTSIFQLGPGVFTANIVPPYKSWSGFFPYLETGLELLLGSRVDPEKEQPFSELRLRYLDAFGEKLTQGKSVPDFLAQNLGIRVDLPQAIMRFCSNVVGIKPSISVVIPIKSGALELKIGEGWVRNVPSLIMDTTVICKGPILAQKQTVLKAFDDAHTIIHESFFEMTATLHESMEPETLK